MDTKYPSQIALEERESALSQEIADYRAARLAYYDQFNLAHVKEIYIERRANSHIRTLKSSASKADHVRALADNDVNGHASSALLRRLRNAADADESIVDKAASAPTYEEVLEARKAAIIAQLDGGYADTHHVADVVVDFEIQLQVARCWYQVRSGIEQGANPSDVLLAVAGQARDSIIGLAGQGINRSSSPTSNLEADYRLRGLVKFLDNVKYILGQIESSGPR